MAGTNEWKMDLMAGRKGTATTTATAASTAESTATGRASITKCTT